MSATKKVLLVDDDLSLRASLAEQLEMHEEFSTVQVEKGAQALERVKAEHFDLVLLDIGLPDLDGREVCRMMRRAGVSAPILMLTAADTDSDAILGLDSGANDYIVKPFRLGVLLARIRSQLRQHDQSEDAVFNIGHYTFRPSAKLLVDNEKEQKVRLTEKETSILKYLYRVGNKVVHRDVLLSEVWGLQCRRHHAHAGDPHLPAASEDRTRSRQRRAPGDRARRLSAGSVGRARGPHASQRP